MFDGRRLPTQPVCNHSYKLANISLDHKLYLITLYVTATLFRVAHTDDINLYFPTYMSNNVKYIKCYDMYRGTSSRGTLFCDITYLVITMTKEPISRRISTTNEY